MGSCSFKFASRFASRVELSTTEDPIDVQFSISVNLITTANPTCSLRSYSKFYSAWHFVCAVHRARMLKRSEMEEISGNWFSIQFASSYGFDASYIHHMWLSTMQNISVHSGSDVSVKLIRLRAGLLRIKGRDVDEMPTPIKRALQVSLIHLAEFWFESGRINRSLWQ